MSKPVDPKQAPSARSAAVRAPVPSGPFHAGEVAVQTRMHVRERVDAGGRRMIRDFMPEQHRELFEKLPYLVLGSVDAQGRPWASLVTGAPGFIASPDAQTLRVSSAPMAGDPLAHNLAPGAALGVLGIEFATRRRNRANGRVRSASAQGFEIEVLESFGNCPKYIHPRRPAARRAPAAPRMQAEGQLLSARGVQLVRSSDTFFIASVAPAGASGWAHSALDVSHRGGARGFVEVSEERERSVLTWPDYVGNSLFNTLGNLELEPRCGLLFIDFAQHDLLLVSGRARVLWSGPRVAALADAERALEFEVETGVLLGDALPFDWSQ